MLVLLCKINVQFLLLGIIAWYRQDWLPSFGVTFDSVFLATFIIYKGILDIVDPFWIMLINAVNRSHEYSADRFVLKNCEFASKFNEAMMLLFI